MKLGPGYSGVLPLAQRVDQELTAWEGAIELANGLYGLRDELVTSVTVTAGWTEEL